MSVLSPPPPPSIGQRAATWWARRHALGRMPFWLLTRAVWVLGPCTALFLLNGLLAGWVGAYEVLVGIASPADVDPGWAAWPLSLVGWAAVPALVGGAAGYLIADQIQRHQSQEFAAVMAELISRTRPPDDGGDDR